MGSGVPAEHRSHMFLNEELTRQMAVVGGQNHLKTRPAILSYLLEEHFAKLEQFPIATFDRVIFESREVPVAICGLARSGKSTTLRESILRRCLREKIPFILIDTVLEHNLLTPEAEMISAGDAMSLKFTGEGSYRVVFNKMPEIMRQEMSMVFSYLNRIKVEGRLRKYVVAIEESHRFDDLDPVYDFVAEAGKFVRKCIVVSSNPDIWKNIALPMRADPAAVEAFLLTVNPELTA